MKLDWLRDPRVGPGGPLGGEAELARSLVQNALGHSALLSDQENADGSYVLSFERYPNVPANKRSCSS